MNYLLCLANQAVLVELAEKIGEEVQTVTVEPKHEQQRGIKVNSETLSKTQHVRRNNTHCFLALHHGKWKYITFEEIVSLESDI